MCNYVVMKTGKCPEQTGREADGSKYKLYKVYSQNLHDQKTLKGGGQ